MGVLYAKVNGAWEPITSPPVAPSGDEVYVGTTDPRPASTTIDLWFDTTVPPGTLKAWDGTSWQVTGGSTVIASDDIPITVPFGLAGAPVAGVAGTSADYSRSDHSHGAPAHGGPEHSHVTPNDLAAPTADVSWGDFGINDLLDPVLAQDAATKQYVDDTSATAGQAAADDITITTVPSTSLSTVKSGSSATGDLTYTITLDSLTLANTIPGTDPDPNTAPVVGEPGDIYIDTVLGTAWINDGTTWVQLDPATATGVMSIAAGAGVAVDSSTPAVPVVSVVVDPASDAALTVSATGISLDASGFSGAADIDTAIDAAITAAAGAGLVEATAGSGVLDVVGGEGIVVAPNLVSVVFPTAGGDAGVATSAARSDHTHSGLHEVFISDGVDPDIGDPTNTYDLWYDSSVSVTVTAAAPNPMTAAVTADLTITGSGFTSSSKVLSWEFLADGVSRETIASGTTPPTSDTSWTGSVRLAGGSTTPGMSARVELKDAGTNTVLASYDMLPLI